MAPGSPEGYTLPWTAPAYGPPPFDMTHCRQVLVQFEADPTQVARLIPPPFEVPERPFACAFVGDMRQVPGPGRYHEGALLLGVKFGDRTSTYAPFLWTSSDEALLVGRELYGMAKMLCEPEVLVEDGNEIVGTIRRRTGPLLRVAFTYGRRGNPVDLPTTPNRLCLRTIPSPDPRVPGLRQVVFTTLERYALHEIWEGRGHVEFFGSAHADLHRLVPRRIVNAWYLESSWTLPGGTILSDAATDPRAQHPRTDPDAKSLGSPAATRKPRERMRGTTRTVPVPPEAAARRQGRGRARRNGRRVPATVGTR